MIRLLTFQLKQGPSVQVARMLKLKKMLRTCVRLSSELWHIQVRVEQHQGVHVIVVREMFYSQSPCNVMGRFANRQVLNIVKDSETQSGNSMSQVHDLFMVLVAPTCLVNVPVMCSWYCSCPFCSSVSLAASQAEAR